MPVEEIVESARFTMHCSSVTQNSLQAIANIRETKFRLPVERTRVAADFFPDTLMTSRAMPDAPVQDLGVGVHGLYEIVGCNERKLFVPHPKLMSGISLRGMGLAVSILGDLFCPLCGHDIRVDDCSKPFPIAVDSLDARPPLRSHIGSVLSNEARARPHDGTKKRSGNGDQFPRHPRMLIGGCWLQFLATRILMKRFVSLPRVTSSWPRSWPRRRLSELLVSRARAAMTPFVRSIPVRCSRWATRSSDAQFGGEEGNSVVRQDRA